MADCIRIGTRKSPLAMLQAQTVAQHIQNQGYTTEIIPIDSSGDIDLVKPIYELGITGVFTKNLDIALLNSHIDIAVHSLKDIPTQLPENISLTAVLERDYPEDVVVWNSLSSREFNTAKIGTGSLRRMAYLKNAFPEVRCENIRGNVQTRIERMKEQQLDGVIFSLAGIKRLNLPISYEVVPYMLSAPGQGVIAICSRKDEFSQMCSKINHMPTFRCIQVEREFLRALEGGCTAPIGAFAFEKDQHIHFTGGICALNGSEKMEISENFPILEYSNQGTLLAQKLIDKGAKRLITNM